MIRLCNILSLIIVLATFGELSIAQPIVSIPGLGDVIGETYNFYRDEHPVIDKNLDVYRGIPFAQPPVGEYRFAKPAPVTPWGGLYNATYFRKPCLQLSADDNPGDEDCLHLNIWTPNPRVNIIKNIKT